MVSMKIDLTFIEYEIQNERNGIEIFQRERENG